MVTYTVHEREQDGEDMAARAEDIVFVKEGLAWWAIVFPVLWLLYHAQWLALAVFLAVLFAIQSVVAVADLPEVLAGLVTMALSVLVAVQGNDLRRWKLARKGYRTTGLVSGRDRETCEQRFFETWLAGKGAQGEGAPKPARTATSSPSGAQAAPGDDIIGLFPEPGK